MKETEDIFEPKNEKEEVFLHPNGSSHVHVKRSFAYAIDLLHMQ